MVKHCIQKDKKECGIAVLKMFYDLYEVNKNYDELCDEINIEDKGISVEELLRSLNIIAPFKAYEVESTELKKLYPAIVMLTKKRRNHYVVIWKYENGYFYVSDPIKRNISKIKEKRLFKLFSGYIIFYQKIELDITIKNQRIIKYDAYKYPYIILSILEVFLLTFSMFYLFSIRDFTNNKIYTFLIILFINFIISTIKNLCFNKIQNNIDDQFIYKNISSSLFNGKINSIVELKNKITNGYQIKNNYFELIVNILPSIFIILGSFIYLFIINKYIFIGILIIYFIVLMINIYFNFIKIRLKNNLYIYERKIDKFNSKVINNDLKNEIYKTMQLMKNISSKYLVINQINGLVNFVIKQFCLMLILIFMYITETNIYSIFVITFYFYSFEGIINISSYIVNRKVRSYLLYDFINE